MDVAMQHADMPDTSWPDFSELACCITPTSTYTCITPRNSYKLCLLGTWLQHAHQLYLHCRQGSEVWPG